MLHRITFNLVALPLLALRACAASKPAEPATTTSVARDPVVQAYVSHIRAELSSGKTHIINEVMHLTPAEAKAFWPVYADYEADLFALGDRRLELIKRFVEAIDGNKMDNAAADAIAKDWLKLQRDSVDLMQAYYTRFAKDVSPLHAAQFLQIEHRTNTVIDLLIASEMPLAMEAAPSGTGTR